MLELTHALLKEFQFYLIFQIIHWNEHSSSLHAIDRSALKQTRQRKSTEEWAQGPADDAHPFRVALHVRFHGQSDMVAYLCECPVSMDSIADFKKLMAFGQCFVKVVQNQLSSQIQFPSSSLCVDPILNHAEDFHRDFGQHSLSNICERDSREFRSPRFLSSPHHISDLAALCEVLCAD